MAVIERIEFERRCEDNSTVPEKPLKERYLAVLTVVALGLTVAVPCFIVLDLKPPLYSAAIDSISGLDDADLGRRPTDLNPLFNVTFCVTTRSICSSGCTHPSSIMEVMYSGVKLATGPVQQFCVKPRKVKEMAVVAWGTALQVPRFALDRLVGDARGGVRVFDVAVTMPSTHYSNHHGKMVSCSGLRVGDATALGTICTVSVVDTVMAMPSGKDGGAS